MNIYLLSGYHCVPDIILGAWRTYSMITQNICLFMQIITSCILGTESEEHIPRNTE